MASDALNVQIVSQRKTRRPTLVDPADVDVGQIDHALNMSLDYINISPQGDTVVICHMENTHLEDYLVKRQAVLLRTDAVTTNGEHTFSPGGSTLYWFDNATGTLHSIDPWSQRNALKLVVPVDELSTLSRSANCLLGFASDTG